MAAGAVGSTWQFVLTTEYEVLLLSYQDTAALPSISTSCGIECIEPTIVVVPSVPQACVTFCPFCSRSQPPFCSARSSFETYAVADADEGSRLGTAGARCDWRREVRRGAASWRSGLAQEDWLGRVRAWVPCLGVWGVG